jgi:hypothetical protein
MNQSRAWRTVCDAALLNDAAATELLCQTLACVKAADQMPFLVAQALLAALAWLDPEQAQTQLSQLPPELLERSYPLRLTGLVEEFGAAQKLRAQGPDALAAAHVQLSLLPRHSQAHVRQSRICQLAAFPLLPATVPTYDTAWYQSWSDSTSLLADWQVLFPLARLWRDQPEATLQRPNHEPPVGIYVLAACGRKSDLPTLVVLIQNRQSATLFGLESAGTFKALERLEQGNPTMLKELLPPLIGRISRGESDHNSIITAKILALAEQYEVELTPLLQKLVERILREKNARTARRWTRTLSWALRTLYPEAPTAYRGAQDLRILALSRTVIAGLTSKASLSPKEEPRLRLCWRWLGRSEALIASVSHAHWQADLLHRKARLENQVARSRKARHRALIQ